MKIETVSVGRPRPVRWNGKEIRTSIFKSAVAGPVRVRRHNLDGDRQSDRRVHGGQYKAVYAYAAEHYDWWERALGLEESAVSIGDVFRIGDAELEAIAPRLPCYKLGIRFGDPRMVQAFAEARRWGIYFRVAREGVLRAGDAVERIHSDPAGVPVSEIARVSLFDREDAAAMERLAAHERLDPSWRGHFAGKLGKVVERMKR